MSSKAAFQVLAGAGFIALAVTVLIGFEQANGVMLLASAWLLIAAPAAVLAGLVRSPRLNREQKRQWLKALTGRRALQAWSAYLASSDHRAVLRRLARPARDGA